jgi:hypothetical protein
LNGVNGPTDCPVSLKNVSNVCGVSMIRTAASTAMILLALAIHDADAQQTGNFPIDAAYRAKVLNGVAEKFGEGYFNARAAPRWASEPGSATHGASDRDSAARPTAPDARGTVLRK